jgi:glycosyltransferase involved in cell wall biosynthesis
VRVAALVESADHVCCRYRLAAFRAAFAAAGHTLQLAAFPDGWLRRGRMYRTLSTFDAVILQRKLLTGPEMAFLRRNVHKLIFDYDDAVWHRDSFAGKGIVCHKRERRFARTVRNSDVIVAGNEYLAEAARKCRPKGEVVVIPTCVEPARYPTAAHHKPGLRLVWVGSGSTLRGLHVGRAVLEAVGRAVPEARLKLVCDQFLRFDPLPVKDVVWAEATEARQIATADVGIAWVPDDAWSRGKCGLKVLQYQAAGLPVIANRVGVHAEMVRDHDTGFLADTPAEWVAAAERLLDPVLRKRLGAAGRKQVEDRYSVAAGGSAWADLLARLAAPSRQAG